MAGAVAGGGALLSASLQVLFDRMASRDVLTVLQGQKLSATLLRELKMKLLAVKVVLNDAEAKQITNSDVKDWVDELKDVVYDAEDLLDDITTEALRCKMESDSQTQVRNIISGEGIKSRIEKITGTLENLAKKKIFSGDSKILLSHNASGNKISVIALVGMGGIGKTTLAKLVYNDRRVVEFLTLKHGITKTILKAIDSGTSDQNDLNLLQHKLEERLTGKKFLLVLDDVWNEDYNNWDSLQTPFNLGLYGSKIVVTTRINKVAAVMHSVHAHHLAKLSSEDCWSLFAKHAFENGNSSPHPKLEEIGKEIVKSGCLILEFRVKEWENVLNSEMWDLPNNAKTMEEVGDGYIYDLLSRSFFKSPVATNHILSEYESFERFETLGEFNSLRTFLPLNLEVWSHDDKVSKNRYPSGSRLVVELHLSTRVWNDLLMNVQYLRVLSLCYYEITNLSHSIGNLKHLRYLDLTYTPIKRLPESICGLYNLQTLILYHCECLFELPKMMCKLVSLRHLDIRHSGVKEMPINYRVGKQSRTRIGELRELSHIGGRLGIEELQNVVDAKDALEANLAGMRYLDELRLEQNDDGGVEQNGADVVLNYLQPHSHLKRLTIHMYGGSRFPDWLGGPSILNMVSLRLWLPTLKHLHIWRLQGIERVGAEFYGTDSSSTRPSFVSLKSLSFQGMRKWKEWLCLGGQGGEFLLIGALPNHLPLLPKLEIVQCEQLVAQLPRIPAIRVLTTRSCDISQWKELPPLLQDLEIQNSDSLESLLEEGMLRSNTCLREPLGRVCLPITLKSLYIELSKKLEFLLPEFFQCHHPFLEWLYISNCTCNSFLSFPLGNFPRGVYLGIHYLEGLEFLSIPISDGDLTSFNLLYICGCPNLVSICCKNLKAACFQSLTLHDCPKLIFPIQVELGLQGLHSLTSLKISDLPNLRSLDGLKLQLLTSLEKLEICNCPKLQSLTEEQLPTNLYVRTIQKWPLLKDRCKFWTGKIGII
ncbi:hypothetical protein AAG906_022100 [Vitis piasezkii]